MYYVKILYATKLGTMEDVINEFCQEKHEEGKKVIDVDMWVNTDRTYVYKAMVKYVDVDPMEDVLFLPLKGGCQC